MTVITVVRGEPSDDELAAVIAVIAARAPARPEQGRVLVSRGRSAWADRSRALRQPFAAGHGTWRQVLR